MTCSSCTRVCPDCMGDRVLDYSGFGDVDLCATCEGSGRACDTPAACHLPEPTQAPKQFRPTFDVDGPYRQRRTLWRRLSAALSRIFNR